jgi:hypothetical protein
MARAQQQPVMPVVGFVSGESLEAHPSRYLAASHAGLRELGYLLLGSLADPVSPGRRPIELEAAST